MLQSVSLQGSRGLFESLPSLRPHVCTLFPPPSLYPPHHVPAALQPQLLYPCPPYPSLTSLNSQISSPHFSKPHSNALHLGWVHPPQPAPSRAASASPQAPCPRPHTLRALSCPTAVPHPLDPGVHVPHPSRRSTPAGPAAPGRSPRFAPPPPLVTTNHSARPSRWGRREPIGRRVRGTGGGARVSRPEEA